MSSPAFDITTRLSDLVATTLKEGPQVVAKDGVETAVLVSIDEWKRLNESTPYAGTDTEPPDDDDPLLSPRGPHDIYIPPRGRYKRRTPIMLE
jgi:prevent-host-death family protein